MPEDFAIHGQQVQTAQQMAQNVQSSASSMGVIAGRATSSVQSPESLLADAAEELSFAADKTEEFEIDERKQRDKVDSAIADRVRMYKELMHQAGKLDKMNALKQSLKAKADRDNIASSVKRYFSDPSDAYTALSIALEELEKEEGNEAVCKSIRQAMADMDAEQGHAIRAGIYGALAAEGYTDLADVDTLKDTYRQTVCEFGSVNDVFKYVNEKYGTDGFDKAMNFLFHALSSDLGSDVPSMEKTHLESVHGNLAQVRLLQSAYIRCTELMARWENIHGIKNDSFTAMDLLGDIVALRNERFLGSFQIDEIVKKASPPDIEHEVLFLQDMLGAVRSFPVRLFDDEQGYSKVFNAVQEAVDHAIEREDEFLASQEN